MTPPLDRIASAPAARELLLLAALAIAARMVVLVASSAATGWSPLDLAMLSDGHSDMVLAKTFPNLYVGTQQLVPFVTIWRDDPYAFFTRFPAYPALIGAGSLVLGDPRFVAIAISQLAGALAVLRFRQLAGYFTARAGLVAALFAVFPATWLETTSMAYTEGLLVLCAISAFHAWAGGRLVAAVLWAGVAAIVQKHGFLVFGALGLVQLASGRRAFRDLAPFALGLVLPLALGVWFWALSGSPTTVLERNSRLFGDGASAFGWPFTWFINGVVTRGLEYPSGFWPRKGLLVTSLAFYLWSFAGAFPRRDARQTPLLVWLGTALAFCSIMGGVWAYYYFPRYVLWGTPAALLLAVDRIRWPSSKAMCGAVVAIVAAASIAAAVFGARSMWEFCLHIWSPRYYEQLRPLLD